MNTSHHSFIARLSLVLFIASLTAPFILYSLTGGRNSEEVLVILFLVNLALAVVLGVIARRELPAQIALIGSLLVLCFLAVFLPLRRHAQQAKAQAAFERLMSARH